jgi:AcrR family transcriptional regulator
MTAASADQHTDYDGRIAGPAPERIRDKERSQAAILDAAEQLFAERGYDGVSLAEIGAASGLSRATPSYFFGSKEQLYTAVLKRAFDQRQRATALAVGPLLQWAEQGGDLDALRGALAEGMDGYMRFLLDQPNFQRFITWEELAGGKRMRAAHRRSTALTDAFTAIKRVARKRGLRNFSVEDAVLLWVTITYSPLANRNTLLRTLDRDLADDRVRRQHVRFAVQQMMFLLTGDA